jgi:uncharacterized protein (DUF2336 family)
MRRLAEHPGARFSEQGLAKLVGRSAGDSRLAQALGSRQDLSQDQLRQLLAIAPPELRRKLESTGPQNGGAALPSAAEANGIANSGVANPDADVAAAELTKPTSRSVSEREIVAFTQLGRMTETTAVLAKACNLPIDAVARAMKEDRVDMILVMARAAGFSFEATKAILRLCARKNGIPMNSLEQSKQTFSRLTIETAQQILRFQRRRPSKSKPPSR